MKKLLIPLVGVLMLGFAVVHVVRARTPRDILPPPESPARSTFTEAGSGTPTVTSTSILPPRARTSWKSGRLECRIASDTARQAALVESRPCTSTPIPNSRTHGFALTCHLRVLWRYSLVPIRVASTNCSVASSMERPERPRGFKIYSPCGSTVAFGGGGSFIS